jgi:hypothetical protein
MVMGVANKRKRTRAETDQRDEHRAEKLKQVRRRITERAAEAARRRGLRRT